MALVMAGSTAMAQENPSPQTQPEQTQPNQTQPEQAEPDQTQEASDAAPKFGLEATTFTFTLGASGSFDGNFDDAPGSVTVFRQSAALTATIPAQARTRIDVTFDTEHAGFDFDDAAGFVPGADAPFEDLWRHRLSIRAAHVKDQTWTFLGGGSVTSAGESGADFGDTITGRVFAGFLYRVSPNFQLGLGGGLVTRLEDNATLLPLPLIQLSYAIDDKTTLTINTFEDINLTHQISEQFAVILSASYHFDEYRLADDGPVPEGVFSHWRVPIGLTGRWTPSTDVMVSLTAGVDVYQNYRIEDSSGNQVADSRVDPALFIAAALRLRF